MVGFRFFTKGLAKKLNIKGSVENLETGEVEIFASGSEENINKFLKKIKQGNFLSDIKNVEVSEIDENLVDIEEFKILR